MGLGEYVSYRSLNGFTIESFGICDNQEKFEENVLAPLENEMRKKLKPPVRCQFLVAYSQARLTLSGM